MSPLNLVDEPFKEGYRFIGWYLDAGFNDLNYFITMPSHNLTLYANFELIISLKEKIPSLVNTKIDGVFPGLFIHKIDCGRYHFIEDTYPRIELHFPEPSMINASFYTLEYYDEEAKAFLPFIYNEEVVISDYNNLVLSLTDDFIFRLHALTIDNENYYSNSVNTKYSPFKNNFAGYNFDQSVFVSGIMAPHIGFGLDFSVTIYDISESENILIEEDRKSVV